MSAEQLWQGKDYWLIKSDHWVKDLWQCLLDTFVVRGPNHITQTCATTTTITPFKQPLFQQLVLFSMTWPNLKYPQKKRLIQKSQK